MKTLKGLVTALTLATGVFGGAFTASAADYTLTISSWTPPTAGMNAFMWPRLIEMIEEATDGRVTAEVKYGLASPPAQLDLVQDGAADISWIFHGYNPGRFVVTKLVELPGYAVNSEELSARYWTVHQKYLEAAGEHRGVKLIGLMVHGPGQIHTADPVQSLDDVKGLKLRIGGGVASDVGEAIGATGIHVSAPKVYETLASHAADGTLMSIEGRKGFNLVEVAPNMFEMPGGFYRASFALIMNEDKFNAMPADIQEALNSVFGENASRMAGKVWDEIDVIGRDLTLATPGNTITLASEADQATFKELSAGIVSNVIAEVSAKGADADAAYAILENGG